MRPGIYDVVDLDVKASAPSSKELWREQKERGLCLERDVN